jgi:hypothetical protein
MALKGQFVASTQGMLDVARSAEADTSKKRSTIRPHKRKAKRISETDVNEELDVVSKNSGSDCINVSMRQWIYFIANRVLNPSLPRVLRRCTDYVNYS